MADTDNSTETDATNLRNMMQSLFGQAQGGDGIGGFIMGFLKFLFESFFPSKDAPDEDPGDTNRPAPTVGEIVRSGKALIDSHAIPNWRAYQQAHHSETVNYINPVKGGFAPITRDFGMHMHPIQHVEKMHTGADLKPLTPGGNPEIMAAAGGVVLFSGEKGGYGNTVIIGHADGSYTLYGHLRGDRMPALGAEVAQGETIGVMGKTGGATGEHLHFEERRGSSPVQPQIGGVALADGVTVAAYTGPTTPAATRLASAAPAAPAHAAAPKPPHAPAPHPAVQAQLASLQLPKFDVAEAYQGAKNAITQGMTATSNAIGSILRG